MFHKLIITYGDNSAPYRSEFRRILPQEFSQINKMQLFNCNLGYAKSISFLIRVLYRFLIMRKD
ncbi:hypothetical protein EMIT047CA2_90201 [Pseudomonas soli]